MGASNGHAFDSKSAVLPVLADVSNRNRRVSFASLTPSQQQPAMATPSRIQPSQSFQTPSSFNYMTAMHSPHIPSFNYAAYHGYGSALPYSNQAAASHGFALNSSFNPAYYSSTPSNVPSQGMGAPIPVYGNQNPGPSRQYSKIVNAHTKKQKHQRKN